MPANRNQSSQLYSKHNRVRFLETGTDFFDSLKGLIANAQKAIHIQTYIFEEDSSGQAIASALQDAARRKVSVYLLVDGYASQSLSRSFVASLTQTGIHFRFFEPVFRSRYFYFGRRMHHKIAVADGIYAIVGGRNIADRYNDLPGIPAWLDFAVLVEGDIARSLCQLCERTWKKMIQKALPTQCKPAMPVQIPFAEQMDIRVRRNDWVRGKNEITATYLQLLRTAGSDVTIICSYFLPGKRIRKAISDATRRGVAIRVIAAGRSDILLAKEAERWLYDWLLRKKVILYEYQDTILHGKLAVCDRSWVTLGSYNLNNISAYASIELNLDIRNRDFAAGIHQKLDRMIANHCLRITPEHLKKTNNPIKQFWRWFSYQFIRLVFYLFTFYFRQNH
ncbi:MAG: phospholipase [Bacteroidota bacterium]|nr:phospholipase [Bacteroidota bacterium]